MELAQPSRVLGRFISDSSPSTAGFDRLSLGNSRAFFRCVDATAADTVIAAYLGRITFAHDMEKGYYAFLLDKRNGARCLHSSRNASMG